jgi:HJR/Mrr/RecB family endonuclease
MNYTEFKQSLLKEGVTQRVISLGSVLEQTEHLILIDGASTQFSTIKEAVRHLIDHIDLKTLSKQAIRETYEELPNSRIASIIKEFHAVKPTMTLVESYLELAASNLFSVDPVVHKIRALNKLDRIIEGKLHYTLSDGTQIAITEQTQNTLNKLLSTRKDIVEYMRESKENFYNIASTLQ